CTCPTAVLWRSTRLAARSLLIWTAGCLDVSRAGGTGPDPSVPCIGIVRGRNSQRPEADRCADNPEYFERVPVIAPMLVTSCAEARCRSPAKAHGCCAGEASPRDGHDGIPSCRAA